MINGLNDTKKHFFVWTIVTVVLFIAFSIGIQYFLSYLVETGELEAATETTMLLGKEISSNLIIGAFLYALVCIPMGWFVRRKFMHWYAHVPTEKILHRYDDISNNLIVAIFRLIECEILAVFDFALMLFYIGMSIIIGIVIFPYHVISGIILMCTRKI